MRPRGKAEYASGREKGSDGDGDGEPSHAFVPGFIFTFFLNMFLLLLVTHVKEIPRFLYRVRHTGPPATNPLPQ